MYLLKYELLTFHTCLRHVLKNGGGETIKLNKITFAYHIR